MALSTGVPLLREGLALSCRVPPSTLFPTAPRSSLGASDSKRLGQVLNSTI